MSAIIVGAGLCGLATAIGLRKVGIRVTVLERSSELQVEVGAGIQIPPNAANVLHQLGVFESIKAVSVRPPAITLRSYIDGSILRSLNLDPCTQTYGYPLLVTHRADLCKILYQKALDDGAEVRFSCDVTEINFQKPSISLSTRESLAADVIVGADGARSVCRERLLGRSVPPKSTGKLIKRICLDMSQLRQDLLLRELVEPNGIHIWLGPSSHIVCYGLQGVFNVVIIQLGHDGINLDVQEADLDKVRMDFQAWEPRVQRIIELAQSALQWPLLDSFLINPWTSAEGSFALVGDAACTVLPAKSVDPYVFDEVELILQSVSAQGAAAGFESAFIFSELLSKADSRDSLPGLLQAYSEARWQRTSRIRELSYYSLRILEMPDGPEQVERDAQLRGSELRGNPFVWADPAIQSWLWGFKAQDEVGKLVGRFEEALGGPQPRL
ncbi:hypothetical protein B0J14DRAFT_624390 [Halenospora varia]|nr:hypothetical protein B0J14DRAFT_624390 [Halenospora varia]